MWFINPQYIFAIKSLILMILILEDRYEPLISIDIKNVPAVLYLTFSNVIKMTKELEFTDFRMKIGQLFVSNVSQKF